MAGYIGSKASVVSSGAERKKTFTITGATTSLTGLNYTVGKVHVFQNGVRLVDGTDYTATNGTSITLTVAAQSGDNVVVISQADFQVSGAVSTSGGTMTGDLTVQGAFTSQGIDDNGNATAITIDSSENVFVGMASFSGTADGLRVIPDHFMSFTNNRTNAADRLVLLNREASDGTHIEFRKANASVGSIGVTAGDNLYIASTVADHAGLVFNNTAASPWVNGAIADGTCQLGSSAARFSNLYLSGGVYLGGTGAANKLDDYEEGTFTPTARGSSSAGTAGSLNSFGKYTKIGRQVNIQMKIDYQSHTGSGTLEFANLPFTSGTNNPSEATGTLMLSDVDTDSARPHLTLYMGGGVTHCLIFQSGDNIGWATVGVTNEVAAFRLSLTYFTS